MNLLIIFTCAVVSGLIGYVLGRTFMRGKSALPGHIILTLLFGVGGAVSIPPLINNFLPGGPQETVLALAQDMPYLPTYSDVYPEEYRAMVNTSHERVLDEENFLVISKDVRNDIFETVTPNARYVTDIVIDNQIRVIRDQYTYLEDNQPYHCTRMIEENPLVVPLNVLPGDMRQQQIDFINALITAKETPRPLTTFNDDAYEGISEKLFFMAQQPLYDLTAEPARNDDVLNCRIGAAYYGALLSLDPLDRTPWFRTYWLGLTK